MAADRSIRAAAIVLVLFGAGVSACGSAGPDPSEGDPGGRVIRELAPVATAVPPGSTMVDSTKRDAVWSPKCPDNPSGKAGWSGVEVLTTFNSTETTQAIVRDVGSALRGQGWRAARPVDESATQYSPVAEWSKSLPGTWSSKVFLFPYPPGQGPTPGTPGVAWMLGAEGKTPGYALPGC